MTIVEKVDEFMLCGKILWSMTVLKLLDTVRSPLILGSGIPRIGYRSWFVRYVKLTFNLKSSYY